MRPLRALAVVIWLVVPATGVAAPGEISDPAMVFSACAGRLSAEMEHRWLTGRDPTEVTRQRATMIELVDATRMPDHGPLLMARRIEAKVAQAALLQRAMFSRDPDVVKQAMIHARAARQTCLSLIAD